MKKLYPKEFIAAVVADTPIRSVAVEEPFEGEIDLARLNLNLSHLTTINAQSESFTEEDSVYLESIRNSTNRTDIFTVWLVEEWHTDVPMSELYYAVTSALLFWIQNRS